MDNLQVVKYSKNKKEEWNSFVLNSKNGTFLFDRGFMEYHADRFTDFSLMIYLNEKLVALLPANIKDDVVYSHQGLSYGGLVFSKKYNFQKKTEAYQTLFIYLKNEGLVSLVIKEIPSFFKSLDNDEDLNYIKSTGIILIGKFYFFESTREFYF